MLIIGAPDDERVPTEGRKLDEVEMYSLGHCLKDVHVLSGGLPGWDKVRESAADW